MASQGHKPWCRAAELPRLVSELAIKEAIYGVTKVLEDIVGEEPAAEIEGFPEWEQLERKLRRRLGGAVSIEEEQHDE